MTDFKLPDKYIPFKELVICSNHFIGGKIPFNVNNGLPLLVGEGDVPQIWLSFPVSGKEGKVKWTEVASSNNMLTNSLYVSTSEDSVSIKMNDVTLIKVKKISDDKAEITTLNLKPLGLNIYGDSTALHVATQTLTNNTFKNVNTMVQLD